MQAGKILVAQHQGAFVIKLVGDVRLTLCTTIDDYFSEMFSIALEYLYTKFILKHPYLLTYPGLRSKQTFCCRCHIQVVIRDFPDIFELLNFHLPGRLFQNVIKIYIIIPFHDRN